MGEKTGNTQKLKYSFNTAGLLEVCIKGTWYRSTGREFRSFDGPRRITEPTSTELGNVNVEMRTYPYNGAVYVFDSNIETAQNWTQSIVTGEKWAKARQGTKDRGI